MNIFGMGLPELAVILVLALLVFGPKKLPEIGRSLGKAIRSFQDASKEFETEFKREAEQLENTVKTSMEASLEPPTQQALSPTAAEPLADKAVNEEAMAEAEAPEAVAVPEGEPTKQA